MNEIEQLVKYKILDDKNFSAHEEPASVALANIKAHLERRAGWFFIDKVFTHIETTTAEDLINASSITITNVIVGGYDESNTVIVNFQI
jgi:hypothetical protein